MQENISLKQYNTFGIDAQARFFFELQSEVQLSKLAQLNCFKEKRLILGGGSNILLCNDFDGLVLLNSLKGIEVIQEDETNVYLKVAAGELWHDLVMFTMENSWAGLENLSLIPGRVGASPMQNIGAYGVELKDVFYQLEAWNIEKEQVEIFNKEQCEFGYRDSIFKTGLKDKYIILSVSLILSKKAKINIEYGAIEETLKSMGVENPSIKDVSAAVIAIRSSKLPNPAEIGNAGSFFKNPVVDGSLVEELKLKYPMIPSYPVDENQVKVPAGWLIEQAGWKGKNFGNYGVHKNQALVLVNFGGAKGKEIEELSRRIQKSVFNKFRITISPEVNFI